MKTDLIFQQNSILILNVRPPTSKEFFIHKFSSFGEISKIKAIPMRNKTNKMFFIRFSEKCSMIKALEQKQIRINNYTYHIREAYTPHKFSLEMQSNFQNMTICLGSQEIQQIETNLLDCPELLPSQTNDTIDSAEETGHLLEGDGVDRDSQELSESEDAISLYAASWNESDAEEEPTEHQHLCQCEQCKLERILKAENLMTKVEMLLKKCDHFKNNSIGSELYNKLIFLKKEFAKYFHYFKSL